jgi:ribosomal subunit interface protein
MEFPLQVTFRDMEPSEAVEARIRERAMRLERFNDDIVSCRVVVETPHRHHHQGRQFHVAIDVTTRGGEIVVNRDHGERQGHEDAYVAIRDAFDALERRLHDRVERRRGRVKTHDEVQIVGKVASLNSEEGYGFVGTTDGREVYFHENAVKGSGFLTLEVGTPVQFVEEPGADGPQATVVMPLARHSLRR